jgi:hypothetical protein
MPLRDVILASAPVAYYPMDDASAVLADASGFARDGEYFGTYTQGAASLIKSDAGGRCVDFGGSDSVAFVDAFSAVNGAAGVTAECWVKADALTGTHCPIRIGGTGGFGALQLYVYSTGNVRVYAKSSSADANHYIEVASGITTTPVYHLAAVADYANDLLKLYVDGIEVASVSKAFSSTTLISGTGAIHIGSDNSGTTRWNGKLDEVAVFSSTLSAATILDHYNAGATYYNASAPAADLALVGYSPIFSPFQLTVPTASLALASHHPASGVFAFPPAASLVLTASAPSHIGSVDAPVAALELAGHTPSPIWTPPANVAWTTVYRCTLTGTADALDDLVLPIESYQARLRSGTPSFVSVVVPDGTTYAAAIAARANGELVIERGIRFATGDEQLVELCRVDLETIASARGGRNWSVTLSGHATSTTTVPKEITLQGASYLSSGSGARRIRAALDLNLRPGDTAVSGSESLVVGLITHTVSPAGELMEISEAVI